MRCIACNLEISDNNQCPCLNEDLVQDEVKFYCLEDAENGITIPPTLLDYQTD